MTSKPGHVSRSQYFSNVGRKGNLGHTPPSLQQRTATSKIEKQFKHSLEQQRSLAKTNPLQDKLVEQPVTNTYPPHAQVNMIALIILALKSYQTK